MVINPFEVPEGNEARALAAWDRFAAYFRRQPGYVSARLHRAVDPAARFHLVTVAEWESAEHFVAALGRPEFQALVASADDGVTAHPGLYEVIR